MERIAKRYGYELVQDLVPPEHAKLLTHIKKQRERSRRKADATDDVDMDAVSVKSSAKNAHKSYEAAVASDENDSDEDEAPPRESAPKGKTGTWIKEQDSDDDAAPVDLLDSNVVGRLLGTSRPLFLVLSDESSLNSHAAASPEAAKGG